MCRYDHQLFCAPRARPVRGLCVTRNHRHPRHNPRGHIRVVDVAKLCQGLQIPHVVNNAYGLQSSKLTHLVNEGMRLGRVDAIIQSTDKNLLVPVGGALVAGPDAAFVDAIGQLYPGRASAAPAVDVFLTLLSLGRQGYAQLLRQRKELFPYCRAALAALAAKHGERLLETPANSISIGPSCPTARHFRAKLMLELFEAR